MSIKVLLVDDHPIMRAGVGSILETQEDIVLLGEAMDGIDAIQKSVELRPDVIVMDISMPRMSGLDATREILKKQPEVRIIALSIHAGERYVKEMLAAGSSGYILKDEVPEDLVRAIRMVYEGEMYLSPTVTRAALSKDENIKEIIDQKVLLSKLHRPPVMTDYVIRSKIIHELESNIFKPLSIISAGAGYGKSATVSQWLEQTQLLYSWISLDEEHNDFRIFLNYLIVAIEKVFPGLLKETYISISAPLLPPVKELAATLINEMCDIDMDFILILEDYHSIQDQRIHELIDEWLLFPPPNVHLCLITRMDPPLKLNPLRVNGRLTEIRMDALSFTKEDIRELFKLKLDLDLDNEALEILHRKTEGWIIILRLFTMLIKDREELNNTISTIEGGHYSISEFLLAEVLSAQNEILQDQLLNLSLLDRFCEDLIDDINEIDPKLKSESLSGSDLIQWLLRMNMFVIPLDIHKKWFRFHHLFQDFLRDQLNKKRKEKDLAQIHLLASTWFEKNGFLTEAIKHAIAANDMERTVGIIQENWEGTLDKDYWDLVENWLKMVPDKVVDQTDNLLLARIWVAQRSHQLHLVPELINKVINNGADLSDAEAGYLAFAQCMLYYFIGEEKLALKSANKALELIPDTYNCFRADVYSYWSFAMMMNGFIDEALHQIEVNKRNINPKDEPIQSSRNRMHPSFIAITQANLPMLTRHNNEFFKLKNVSPYMLGWGTYIKCMISWWGYQLEESISIIEEFLKYRYQSSNIIVMDGYVCLAIANEESGNSLQASKVIDSAIQYAEKLNDPAADAALASGQARLNLLRGNQSEAEEWLARTKEAPLNPTMFFWVEIPSITRCRVMISRGSEEDLTTAIQLLEDYRAYSRSVFNKMREIDILVLKVLALKKLGLEEDALNALKNAIELSAAGRWVRPFAEQINDISYLLKKISELGIHPRFIGLIFDSVEKSKALSAQVKGLVKTKSQNGKEKVVELTPKEREVLQYVAKGLRNQEIADVLFNSQDTIKRHIYNMFQKFNVKNRLSLVTKAKEEGMLKE